MRYKEAVKKSMETLAQNEKAVFLGYNICFGSKAYGTLANVPDSQKTETPIAENLMIGLATGMALEGYHPLVFFERHDFVLNALDGIVNHVSKLEEMSKGQFSVPVIIRAVVGSKNPLHPGPQHTQDFTEIFKRILGFPVYTPTNSEEVLTAYNIAKNSTGPIMIIERRDLYDKE